MRRTPRRNPRRTPSILSVALLAGFVLAGCNNPRPNPAQPDPFPPPINHPRVNVVSPQLERGIGVQEATIIPAGPGPMRVQVPVRSLTDHTYLLDYRFTFFDENGMMLEPRMGWRMVTMRPRQIVQMNASSLDDRAHDWRLELKWAE